MIDFRLGKATRCQADKVLQEVARARNTRAPVSGRRGVRRPGPRRDGREKYEGKESINGAYYRRDQFFSL